MSWQGFVFAYLPSETDAVPAGQLELHETGTESSDSLFGYGKRYVTRSNAIPVDPVSLPLNSGLFAECSWSIWTSRARCCSHH